MSSIQFNDLGLMDYQQAWDLQEKLFSDLMESKVKAETDHKEPPAGTLLFVEHPHVFTLGKSGAPENLLVNEDFLKSKGAAFYRINRGGDITYHGPGQIVGYPIINLDAFKIGVREYIFRMETAVIQTLKSFDVEAGRLEGATGVWLEADLPGKSRKICAIGVRASRGVTMHGFAFNVNTDLSFYNLINPCGFTDKGVTSMEKELGHKTAIQDVKDILLEKFLKVFNTELISV
ncbi:MAG: lipoyl(octanoyl) transferase LipB [Bacteroidales bacterium]|nr:lipoyl(octanoyl) transferase LipB [Bacteroidales bacterium]